MADDLHDRVQRLEDILEIQQLFIDYGHHLDAGDFEAYASLFANEGEVLLGPLGRARGRDGRSSRGAKPVLGTRSVLLRKTVMSPQPPAELGAGDPPLRPCSGP